MVLNLQTVTVRPTAATSIRSVGFSNIGGAANAGAALRDDSSATYIEQNTVAAYLESTVDMTTDNPTIPTGAKIYGVRNWGDVHQTLQPGPPFEGPNNLIHFGHRVDNPTTGQIRANIDYVNAHPASETRYVFGWWTSRPYGGEWTTTDLNNMLTTVSVIQQAANVKWRVYDMGFDVGYNTAPYLNSLAPSGTVTTTTRPTLTMTYLDDENDSMVAYRVKIFTASQADPGGATADVWDSGKLNITPVTAGGGFSIPIGIDLSNNTTYFAYVQVYQDWSISEHGSPWTTAGSHNGTHTPSVSFTISISPPGIPDLNTFLEVQDTTYGPYVSFNAQMRDNLLTENAASLETNTTGWAAGTNTNIARSTAQFLHGAASLSLTSIAAGNISAFTNPRSNVVGNKQYTALAYFRSAAVVRSAFVQIDWFNGASAFISSSVGSVVTTTTGTWQASFIIATAPSTAVTASVTVAVQTPAGASEVHYVDMISLVPTLALGINLLTLDQQSVEATASGWLVGANTTLSRVTTQAYQGLAAMQLANNSGGASDISVFASPRAPVVAGNIYQLSAYFKSNTTVRSARTEITWTTALSGGSTISTITGASVTEVGGGWVQATVTGIAPATALGAACTLRIIATAAGEIHFVDWVFVQQLAWSIGGVAGLSAIIVERSDDGVTWTEATSLGSGAVLSGNEYLGGVIDWETGPHSRYYRAKARATVLGLTLSSAYSPIFGPYDIAITNWWLKDPSDYSHNMTLFVTGDSLDTSKPEADAVFSPLGRTRKVVVADSIYGEEFDLELLFTTEADYQKFEVLRNSQRTLLLQAPISTVGTQWYVRLVKDRKTKLLNTADPWRRVTVSAVEVDEL